MTKTYVAITGGTGFIGSNLLSMLGRNENYHIRVLDRRKHELLRPPSMESLLAKADIVVHLAGANRGSWPELFHDNVQGTFGLLEGMSSYCPNAILIFASSAQAYKHQSFYGLTKKVAEQLIEQYATTKSMRAFVMRLSNVYGPGGQPFYNSVIATFEYSIHHRMKLIVKGDGTQIRDYIFVSDVCDAIVKAMERKPKEPFCRLDVCSGETVSVNELINAFEKIVGHRVNVLHQMEGEGHEDQATLNCLPARTILGWRPKMALEEGLQLVMEEYQNRT